MNSSFAGWQSSVLIFDLPDPGLICVVFGTNINLLSRKIDVSPSGIQQFASAHPGTQVCKKDHVPTIKLSDLYVSRCFHQSVTLFITVHMDFTIWCLWLFQVVKWVIFELMSLNRQIKLPFQGSYLLCYCGRAIPFTQTSSHELLTMFLTDAAVIYITNHLDELPHSSIIFPIRTFSNTSARTL